METLQILGNRLKEERKNKGMTQEEVAQKINISRASYAYYEAGKKQPSLDTLKKLGDLFKVSLDYLTGRY
jgi:transcriptional regulator with XRE-family HTH domain